MSCCDALSFTTILSYFYVLLAICTSTGSQRCRRIALKTTRSCVPCMRKTILETFILLPLLAQCESFLPILLDPQQLVCESNHNAAAGHFWHADVSQPIVSRALDATVYLTGLPLCSTLLIPRVLSHNNLTTLDASSFNNLPKLTHLCVARLADLTGVILLCSSRLPGHLLRSTGNCLPTSCPSYPIYYLSTWPRR